MDKKYRILFRMIHKKYLRMSKPIGYSQFKWLSYFGTVDSPNLVEVSHLRFTYYFGKTLTIFPIDRLCVLEFFEVVVGTAIVQLLDDFLTLTLQELPSPEK